jgi:hypothetical protein
MARTSHNLSGISWRKHVTICQVYHDLTKCNLFSPWYTWQNVTCSRHDIPDKLLIYVNQQPRTQSPKIPITNSESQLSCEILMCKVIHVKTNKIRFLIFDFGVIPGVVFYYLTMSDGNKYNIWMCCLISTIYELSW